MKSDTDPTASDPGSNVDPSSDSAITYTASGPTEKLFHYLKRTWKYREFIFAYASAELRGRYLRNRLTTLWLVLNPLMLAGTYTLLVLVLRARENPIDLLAFITSGLFFFMFFRDSIVKSANSLTRATSLLLSSDLPKAALPISATVESALAFGIAMLTYIPLHIATGQHVGIEWLLIIPVLVVATVFSLGTSLLLAFSAARVRDLVPFLPFALRLLLYLSPVLFTLEDLQGALPDSFGWVLWLNPLAPFLGLWHDVLGLNPTSALHWAVASSWAALTLVVGLLVAHRNQHSIGAQL